MRIVEPTMQ